VPHKSTLPQKLPTPPRREDEQPERWQPPPGERVWVVAAGSALATWPESTAEQRTRPGIRARNFDGRDVSSHEQISRGTSHCRLDGGSQFYNDFEELGHWMSFAQACNKGGCDNNTVEAGIPPGA